MKKVEKFLLNCIILLSTLILVITSFEFFNSAYPKDDTFSSNLPKVCFVDEFGKEDMHGELVIETFKQYNDIDVEIVQINYETHGFTKLHGLFKNRYKEILDSCDFINYSMGDKTDKDSYLETMINFLETYAGILVVAAGNGEETVEESQWSKIRNKHPKADWNSKLNIVTQGTFHKFEEHEPLMKPTTSYGREVDFVVDYEITGNHLGSSFSTPFVTALLVNEKYGDSTLLEKNGLLYLEMESVKSNQEKSDENHLYKGITTSFNTEGEDISSSKVLEKYKGKGEFLKWN